MKPSHFNFTTIVEKVGPGAGGWRTACVHLMIKRATGEAYTCIFNTEVPIETEARGVVSIESAQRHSAKCANSAAQLALGSTTAETPLGMACTAFIAAYAECLEHALRGSRVTRYCLD